jgi:hypothetical protein
MAKRVLNSRGRTGGAGRPPARPGARPIPGKRVRIYSSTANRIREIIEDWSASDLSWDSLVEAANKEFQANWTRQSLANHDKIQQAFQRKKDDLRKARQTGKPAKVRRTADTTVDYLDRTVRTLQAENDDLRKKLVEYEARFARWRHNAYLHRLTVEQLDEPLQENDRGRSDR